MVGDPALRVGSTEARTGVPALLLHTGSGLAALGADKAFRPAVGRCSDHSSFTGAHTHSVLLLVLAVGATGVWVTRVGFLHYRDARGDEGALGDGVPGVSIETGADGHVAESIADGVDATYSGARIHTLVVDTSPVAGTVSVENTLGSAGKVGVTEVARDTLAGPRPLPRSALGVGSTGCRVARIDHLSRSDCGGGDHNPLTVSEGVPSEASRTSADRLVVLDIAFSIWSTGSGAGVDTPLVETGPVARALRVDGALRAAVGRYSDVVWLAGTGCHLVALPAGGEGSTG